MTQEALPECCAGEGYPGIAHDLLAARTQRDHLRLTLEHILLGSLLDARRAAFSPKIGVRYTEAIRLDIAAALAHLEEAARGALERVGS